MKNAKIDFDMSLMGYAVLISLLLVVLKIAGVINWGILAVLSPIIAVVGFIFLIVFFIGLLTILAVNADSTKDEESEQNESSD